MAKQWQFGGIARGAVSIAFLIAVGLSIGACAAASGGHGSSLFATRGQKQGVVDIDTQAELEKHVRENHIVFLGFCKEHCGPCRYFKPRVADMAKRYAGKVVFVCVNIERHEEMLRQYDIRMTPDLRLYVDGEIVRHWQGYQRQSDIEKAIDQILRG